MQRKGAIFLVIIILGVLFWILADRSLLPGQPRPDIREDTGYNGARENRVLGERGDTSNTLTGEAVIEGVGTFSFNPGEVRTVRPDIFQEGHFSLFDVLLHLHQRDLFEMEYHFDEAMNTHVISSLNGRSGWWYNAYYDGGWPETSVFRMDHYPYKDGMFLSFVHASEKSMNSVYNTYRDEVTRKKENDGRLIVPEVIIRGREETLRFENVEVRPHDLRQDMFQPGVITAIDVILSLGEEGKISYDLQWQESIGKAKIVKSYWVNRVNKDESSGRCGFVYESGAETFRFFRGNHIHIPSDVRVINSPEYVEYFWICI